MPQELNTDLAETYLECGGTFCPFCGSHDIKGGPVAVEEGVATQTIGCDFCHEEWVDVYELKEVRYVPGDDRANTEVPVDAPMRTDGRA